MEEKYLQKSTYESKLFEIPIEKYENDMETESAKSKKQEILDLFTNYNKLKYQREYDNIKFNLHRACREGDLELIKILLSKEITNCSRSFEFKIDETNRTASLFKTYEEEVIVPRTVEHKSVEYLITSISGLGYRIKTLKFADDSAVETIYGYVFPSSSIKEICFPPSLKKLKEGWCFETDNLTRIRIPPSNKHFKFIDNKYLLGKSDQNNDEFDVFLFANRCISEISIPPSIRIISSCAFYSCNYLKKVEIPKNSNLQSIGKYAFAQSNIKEIYIPSSLKDLKEGWCYHTNCLTEIIISPSNNQFILKDDKYLLGKSNQNNSEFDIFLFASRDIKKVFIPSNIKIISSYAFFSCFNLKKVEIETSSNLQRIGEYAFFQSKIKEIYIPSKVSRICEYAFNYCNDLEKVEIPTNAYLQVIESNAFAYSSIKKILIPKNVSQISDSAFLGCYNLRNVEIPTSSKLKTIEQFAFANSSIRELFIPYKISNISQYAFKWCYSLQIIEISEDIELKSISLLPFYPWSQIIMVPSLRK